MNPLEFYGVLHTALTDKIQMSNKETFTKEEVLKMLDKIGENYKKAICNGSYIFNIEELNGNSVTIEDDEYVVKKLLTEENKSLLFIQVAEKEDPITDSDIQILAEAIQKGVAKSSNISGVIIVPPNMDVSLITASLDKYQDIKGLEFTETEIDMISKLQDEMSYINSYDDILTTMPKYFRSKKTGMSQIYNSFFGSSGSTTNGDKY